MASKTILLPLLLVICSLSLSPPHQAIAKPLRAPDINNCKLRDDHIRCCIPTSEKIVDFKLPPPRQQLRIRRPAHLVDEEYKMKYMNATRLMKELPAEHSWNFYAQAAVHCAYAGGAYHHVDHPNNDYNVHRSWLFLPFHRAYLYFYERILGKLIDDETFALPFWNWDAADGMSVPRMYRDPTSPLYDDTRLPLYFVSYGEVGRTKDEMTNYNYVAVYKKMVIDGKNATEFFGGSYREGDNQTNGGQLETGPHGPVHTLTSGDMNDLSTSALDPVFFAHHSNVDRMWEVWRDIHGWRNGSEITDPDWLDASFLFWDENQQLVRIKVSDVLDTDKLGYTYEKVPLPWLSGNHTDIKGPDEHAGGGIGHMPKFFAAQATASQQIFPLILSDAALRIQLLRKDKLFGKLLNPQKEEDEEEEVVCIKGIKYKASESVWFDIYVSVESTARLTSVAATGDQLKSVWAGNYVNIASRHRRDDQEGHELVISLGDLLKSLGAEQKKMIIVTLAPRQMTAEVQIGSVEVKYKTQV